MRRNEEIFIDYENLKSILQTFIDDNGYFPSQKQMRYDLHIPESIPSRFGGSEKIMKDMGVVENYSHNIVTHKAVNKKSVKDSEI